MSPPNCAPWPRGCSPWRIAWKPTLPPPRSRSRGKRTGCDASIRRWWRGWPNGGWRRFPPLRHRRAAGGVDPFHPGRVSQAEAAPVPTLPGTRRCTTRDAAARGAGPHGEARAALVPLPPAPDDPPWWPNPQRRRLRHRQGGHGTGARQAEREGRPTVQRAGHGGSRPSAARNRCAALRPAPSRRRTAGNTRARSGGSYATAPCPDRWPAMARSMAPERPAKMALPRAASRTRRRAGRRSRCNRPVAMRWLAGLPRPPSRLLAARRVPALGSEPKSAAATPPPGWRREASLPRAGSG